MKYERIKEESREYKYGPGEEFENEVKAKDKIKLLQNQVLTSLILKGFRTSIEEIKIVKVEGKDALKLVCIIRYPIEIINNEEEFNIWKY